MQSMEEIVRKFLLWIFPVSLFPKFTCRIANAMSITILKNYKPTRLDVLFARLDDLVVTKLLK